MDEGKPQKECLTNKVLLSSDRKNRSVFVLPPGDREQIGIFFGWRKIARR